jgi:hypothetical protein
MDTNRLLTAKEYEKIRLLFDMCDFAEIEDTRLFETGNHRDLYNHLCLCGFQPPFGRGPVFNFADELIAYNERYWKTTIICSVATVHGISEALRFAKVFLSCEIPLTYLKKK